MHRICDMGDVGGRVAEGWGKKGLRGRMRMRIIKEFLIHIAYLAWFVFLRCNVDVLVFVFAL